MQGKAFDRQARNVDLLDEEGWREAAFEPVQTG
jgi:hypothetical protein